MAENTNSPQICPGDLVMCDFDGTISVEDTGLLVFDALNLEEAWEVEWQWRRGEIGSMQCLAEQWGFVKLPPDELLALIDSFELDPDFPRFVDLCRQRRVGLVVVSDGLDFYLDRMLSQHGFQPCQGDRVLEVTPSEQTRRRDRACNGSESDNWLDCLPRFANHVELTEAGIAIEFPHRAAECSQCGNCKTSHLFRLRPHFRRVIYLGDGHSDMCPARYADLILAKADLAEYCQREGIRHLPFNSFADVLPLVT